MSVGLLKYRARPAADEPAGLLVLIHGRGADENDLYPLFDMLDPDQRLLGVSPRGPLTMSPGGAHWYAVHRVGFPDPVTFAQTFDALSRWLDALVEDHGLGHDRVVIGGFSQGAVMSFALSLGGGRPRPAGTIALSGFMPTVEDLELDFEGLQGYPVAIGHGSYDDIITADFSRSARTRLEVAGAHVTYKESPLPHAIDPRYISELQEWLRAVLP
ncbi:MAG: alpha/beta hydrolase [Actinomycetota bacterium]